VVGAMTVLVAGETPSNLNSDKIGEFVRQVRRREVEMIKVDSLLPFNPSARG
jgi:fructose-1-phosphate kinase PfkB-like protein